MTPDHTTSDRVALQRTLTVTPADLPAFGDSISSGQRVVSEDLALIGRQLSAELESMAGGRLLLTGGAGFLGYYLVQTISHWNRQVPADQAIRLTVYDNFLRGVPPWLAGVAQAGAVSLQRHDITAPLPEDLGAVDYIIHAASIASPTYYRRYPLQTMDANVSGLRHLLDYVRAQQARGKPLRGFLFFSTSEIYGDPPPEHIPTPETYRGNVSCTGPRACYDESKRYGETLCVTFAREYGLPISIARPFNNYGPGLRLSDRRVLADLARDVLAGRDLVLLSDGSPTRTFCYVADAVVGYYQLLTRGRAGEAYNIGVEAPEVSMAELAERVAELARELFGYRGRVVRRVSEDQNYLVDNPNRRCPTIAKARADLGFSPRVSLDEGLRRSLLWFAANREDEERP